MGILCCKKAGVPSKEIEDHKNSDSNIPKAPNQKEISIPSYASTHDKAFSKLETTYNLLREISLEHLQ